MIYTPLYIESEYTLLDSLIKIKNLVKYALDNNIKSLGICDTNLNGTYAFYKECINNNIKPIIGFHIKYEEKDVLLFAKSEVGYHNLLLLNTYNNDNNINIEVLKKYNEDIICILPFESRDLEDIIPIANIFIGFKNKEEEKLLKENKIYINKINCLTKEDHKYLKYLRAIKEGKKIELINDEKNETHLLLEKELDYDLTNNYKIYEMCNIKLENEKNLIPKYKTPDNMDSYSYLKKLCIDGLKRIFNDKVGSKYLDRLKMELNIINEMNFCDYFLIVYDYVKYARESGIPVGPGRGSASGSLVSYLLDITKIDPLKYGLLFERFLNKERITMPDIDIDFDSIRKEEVIEYVKSKYGIKNVANIMTYSSLTTKQVLKDVGKTLDLKDEFVDYFARMFDSKLSLLDNYNKNERIKNHLEKNPELKELFEVSHKLENIKRHISIHASGVVISEKELDKIIPLEKYKDDYLTGFTAEFLEELGLLKMDFLSLATLTTYNNMLTDLDKEDNYDIDLNDKLTLELFNTGKTLGIFQFEKADMIEFLKKFKVNSFSDLCLAVALYRPGPISNIDTFIDIKNGKIKPNYFDPSLEKILKPTNGIIIYQEQIILIANIMAKYSLGEADILRRAMSKKKVDVLVNEKEKFITRSIENGYSEKLAKEIYENILQFASYGFPKAHAVAYSMVSFKIAYIKAHYPLYFYKHMLNDVIGSIDSTYEYITEAKELGISIIKPDINISDTFYTTYDNKIYYSILNIKNINKNIANNIIIERKKGKFTSFFDFVKRVDIKAISKDILTSLINSGCFDKLDFNRKTLINNLDTIINFKELLNDLESNSIEPPELIIEEEYKEKELINNEYKALGLYLTAHPINQYRKNYNIKVHLNNINNYYTKVIDIIARVDKLKEVTTKDGDTICFMKISDEQTTIEAPIFKKAYSEIKGLEVGDIVKIRGRANIREGREQFIVFELEILDKIGE